MTKQSQDPSTVIYASKTRDVAQGPSGGCTEEVCYAHPAVVNNKGNFPDDAPCKTFYDGFYYGWERAKSYGDCRLLGYRAQGEGPYKWIDYAEVEKLSISIGSHLASLGLVQGDMVGIYSRTRMEWMLTLLGCTFQSLVVVPLYDTLGDESILHILHQTQFTVIVVSLASEVRKLISLWDGDVRVKHIFLMDWPTEETDGAEEAGKWTAFVNEQIESKGVTCQSFDKLKEANLVLAPNPPDKDCVFEICYTSGTVGKPKGAVYHHGRMVSECMAVYKYIRDNLERTAFETALCYLPLAHSYELAIECYCVMSGCKLGYFNGNARKILDDIQVLKPTILAAVPRVLTRIHEGIMQKTSRQQAGVVRNMLFQLALRQKMARHNRGVMKETYMEKLFFKRLHQVLGGRLKCVFVGSSATSPLTIKVLRATLGIDVCEGYGQTETYGVSFVQVPGDFSTRCVGGPLVNLKFKVIDVPDLNYYSRENEGELCIKGPSTISEYYRNPEETAKCRDAQGWIHTGDVARIHPNGSISIIDRVKEFFKLAQGEFVIPSKVECVYTECQEIENVFVWGNPLKNSCIAIVFPNTELLMPSLKKANINVDASHMHKSKAVKEHIMKAMEQAASRNGLKGFEKAKNIYISPKPLIEYPNLLTPTFKYKRHAIVKHFEKEINSMYESIVDKPL